MVARDGERYLVIPPPDQVWPAIESVRLYNPMALLASLPPFVDQFLECTPVRVR